MHALTASWVERAAEGRGRQSLLRFAVTALHGEAADGDAVCEEHAERVLTGETTPTSSLAAGLRALWQMIDAAPGAAVNAA